MSIRVDWKHVLLDPSVFAANGTFRVARVRGGLLSFPLQASGSWTSPITSWSPDTPDAGYAPPSYDYEGRRFNLGFWSVKTLIGGRLNGAASHNDNEFSVSYPAGDIQIDAKAIYYWDFGGGGGPHAVYVDAFDDTNQEFIPDDFVDVIPDDDSGSLTREANNGRLSTEKIGASIIRARSPTGDSIYRQYGFARWTNEQDLSRIGPETVPTIAGADIRIRQGSVIAALAHYAPVRGSDIPKVVIPPEGGTVIGNPADGPYIYIPFGGTPTPIGPMDPTLLASILLLGSGRDPGQMIQIDELRKRIAALERAT